MKSLRLAIFLSLMFALCVTPACAPYLNKDTRQPGLSSALTPRVLTQGGSALLLLRGNKPPHSLQITAGGRNCTILEPAPGRYAALIAFNSKRLPGEYKLRLTANDAAGNTSSSILSLEGKTTAFRQDHILLNEHFFLSKHQEFKKIAARDGGPVELFLLMNRAVRASSYAFLKRLCANGHQKKLWSGAFLEMPRAVRRSEFADQRDYLYNGQVIDRQVHLGLDYASVAKDKIPAANDGVVVYIGPLGIHGQAVLLDHGLGLFSLYSHLSSIKAQTGQAVRRGEIIGRTGSSGMAAGDHLHFEILLNGISVNPDPWFDAEWVRLNIEQPLRAFTGENND